MGEQTLATSRTGVDLKTRIGAEVAAGGVTFRLWAPAARQVFVLTGQSLAAARQPGFQTVGRRRDIPARRRDVGRVRGRVG